MIDNSNFQTYLFVSSSKLNISLYNQMNERIYQKEFLFKGDETDGILKKIESFLNENILSIEKKFQKFIKKISIILDLETFFLVSISVKKNNHNDKIKINNLNYLLQEAKDYCKKTIDGKKIIHMTIENYNLDNKNYVYLPSENNCNSFSLDIKFVCIDHKTIKNFEEILKKYQISLAHLVSGAYIRQFLDDENKDIFLIAKKMINGHNPNEVMLVDKTLKKQGFFEKFFNFFS